MVENDVINMIFYTLTSAETESDVGTGALKAKVLTTPEGPSRCLCIRKTYLIAIIA